MTHDVEPDGQVAQWRLAWNKAPLRRNQTPNSASWCSFPNSPFHCSLASLSRLRQWLRAGGAVRCLDDSNIFWGPWLAKGATARRHWCVEQWQSAERSVWVSSSLTAACGHSCKRSCKGHPGLTVHPINPHHITSWHVILAALFFLYSLQEAKKLLPRRVGIHFSHGCPVEERSKCWILSKFHPRRNKFAILLPRSDLLLRLVYGVSWPAAQSCYCKQISSCYLPLEPVCSEHWRRCMLTTAEAQWYLTRIQRRTKEIPTETISKKVCMS